MQPLIDMSGISADLFSSDHPRPGDGAERLELRFIRGDAGADELQAIVDEVVAELADPASDAARAARDAGLDPHQVAGMNVEIRESAQGLDPSLVGIIVGIVTALGSKVAESLWTDLLWPRIQRRLGVGSLKQPTKPGQ